MFIQVLLQMSRMNPYQNIFSSSCNGLLCLIYENKNLLGYNLVMIPLHYRSLLCNLKSCYVVVMKI